MNINHINNYNIQPNFFEKSVKKAPVYSAVPAPSFKGGKEGAAKGAMEKFGEWISEKYAKYYAEPLMNKDWLHKLSKKLTKFPGSMTEHMATLGSAITSSVYMARTLQNKDLDDDKKKTLAINQGLCFVVPTICAYTVNHLISDFNKKLEYRYSAHQEAKKAKSKMTEAELKEFNKLVGERLKGFKVLASLATFTLIYRYVTPVIITPIANWIGQQLNSKEQNK